MKLDIDFTKLILDPQYALGFLLQLVKYGRQVKTIKHYRNAMQKMVDYLVEGDLVDTEASQEFQKSSAMLDNITTGRKCKDATVHLHKKIEQTKLGLVLW